jgi:AcrR family transcriptional regulator
MKENPNANKILLAAVELAKWKDYKTISRHSVAKAAEVSPAMVQYYFDSMYGLWEAVIKYAIEHEILSIIARGYINNAIAPQELKWETRKKLNTYFTSEYM